MKRLVGGLATGLGLFVRFILIVWAPVLRSVGFGLMSYGVFLFDVRLGFFFAGACLFVFTMQLSTGARR